MRYLKTMTAMMLGIILLSGCMTQKKVNNYLLDHPEYSSRICDQLYPTQAESSTSQVDVQTQYKPADNADYTKPIDSLNNEISSLTEALEAAKLEAEYLKTHAPDTCRETVDAYEKLLRKNDTRIADLQRRLKALQAAYKPCEPDTLTITKTITITNSVASTAQSQIIRSLEVEKALAKEGQSRWRIIGIIASLIAIGLLVIIFKK